MQQLQEAVLGLGGLRRKHSIMAFGVIGAVVEALMYGPEGMDFASMSMLGIDPVSGGTVSGLDERTFQFWPESISDTIDIGWSFKDIPGSSYSLAQWGSNGGRTISFELQFHRFMKPKDVSDENLFEKLLDPFGANTPASEFPKDNRPYNVDIAAEVKYLRAFCEPSYADVEGFTTAYPPPIAMLAIPNLELGEVNDSNVIYAIMTGCDVTYTLLFPNGTPRRATVALTFRQIIQDPLAGEVYLVGHSADYSMGGSEDIGKGGERKKNDIVLSGGPR